VAQTTRRVAYTTASVLVPQHMVAPLEQLSVCVCGWGGGCGHSCQAGWQPNSCLLCWMCDCTRSQESYLVCGGKDRQHCIWGRLLQTCSFCKCYEVCVPFLLQLIPHRCLHAKTGKPYVTVMLRLRWQLGGAKWRSRRLMHSQAVHTSGTRDRAEPRAACRDYLLGCIEIRAQQKAGPRQQHTWVVHCPLLVGTDGHGRREYSLNGRRKPFKRC